MTDRYVAITGWDSTDEPAEDSVRLGSMVQGVVIETPEQAIALMRKRSDIVEIGEITGAES